MKRSLLVIFIAILHIATCGIINAQPAGNGTEASPYLIGNLDDLLWIRQNMIHWDKHFLQTADIDASETVSWDDGKGWNPIGVFGGPFSGTYDGGGNKITGLTVNRPSHYHPVGLFGQIESSAVIKNITLVSVDIIGANEVGGLAGMNYGTIINCTSSGEVRGLDMVGGLVGDMIHTAVIDGSSSTAWVYGGMMTGGLVGVSSGEISASHYEGNVRGGNRTGGLVGDNRGTVTGCHAMTSGVTHIQGDNAVGGIAGRNVGVIAGSWADTDVRGNQDIGGIAGLTIDGTLTNSFYNIDETKISQGNHITSGGIFNDQYQDWVNNSYSLNISDYSSTLTPSGDYYEVNTVQGMKDLLGFAGETGFKFRLAGNIDLSGQDGFYIPILASEFYGNGFIISNMSVDLSFVSALGLLSIVAEGALVQNLGVMNAQLNGSKNVGAVAGYNNGMLSGCFSTGQISGIENAGGLVGYNNAQTENSYSNAAVSGQQTGGGFVGRNSTNGSVVNSYSAGAVTGGQNAGGFAGPSEGSFSACFWDTETSGRQTSAGGTGVRGKVSMEMASIETYTDAGWPFPGVWQIMDNQTYPYLQWQGVASEHNYPPSYNVELASNPEEGGVTEGGGTYIKGQQVTASAIPNEGYAFISWTDEDDNVASTQSEYTFSMPVADIHLTANFELVDYAFTIEVNPAGSGEVSADPEQEYYNFGDEITLNAIPAENYHFIRWTDSDDNTVSTDAGFVYTMPSEDVALTACFARYTLTTEINPEGAGTVSLQPDEDYYNEGDEILITATPSGGYSFIHWADPEGNPISSDAEFLYTMPGSDITITAYFGLYNLTVDVDPEGAGTVSTDPPQSHFNEGDEFSFSASPAPGWSFVEWVDAGDAQVSEDPDFDHIMPGSDLSLTARFEPVEYTLSLEVNPEGSGTIETDPEYDYYNVGDEVTVTATPEDGYHFLNWTGENNNVVSTSNEYSFTMPADDLSLTANFGTHSLDLEVDPEGAGTVSADPEQLYYNTEDEITLKAAPEEGWEFSGWIIDGDVISTEAEFVYSMPDGDVLVTGRFVLSDFNLAVGSDPDGAIESLVLVPEHDYYNIGDEILISVTAAEGYEFENWRDEGGNIISTDASFTFTMPANDVILTAQFITLYTLTVEVTPEGAGTVSTDPDEEYYWPGDEVTLTAIPEEGFYFMEWTDSEGNVLGDDAVLEYTMPGEDVILTAGFARYSLSVVVDPEGAGSVSVDPERDYYNEGDEIALSAVANELYDFINWTDDDGNIVSADAEFIFTMPVSDMMLTANFEFYFAGGSGTAEDPYLVSNATHLDNVRLFLGHNHGDKHFKQTADINLATSPWNEEDGWVPVGASGVNSFSGTYNGDGHIIDGLYIDRPASANQGLFGSIRNASISGVKLQNVDVTGRNNTGALAGNLSHSEIVNCHSSGSVNGNDLVGGLAGRIFESSVTASSSMGDVTGTNRTGGLIGGSFSNSIIINCFSICDVSGNNRVGGLIGSNDHSEINNSYAMGSVSGRNPVGGFVGVNGDGGLITGCYSTGRVSGNTDFGGFAGLNDSDITGSFWNIHTSNQPESAGGDGVAGKTTQEMVLQDTYADWDFADIWGIDEGDTYPFLQWQEEPGGFNYAPDLFSLTLIANPETGGTVKGQGVYPEGTDLFLKTVPAERYQFVNWTGEDEQEISDQLIFMYTMQAEDITLTANFYLPSFDLNVVIAPENAGSVNIVPEQDSFHEADEVVLTAIPADGFKFQNWYIDGMAVSSDEEYTIIMPAEEMTLEARFTEEDTELFELLVTASPPDGGTVAGGGFYGDEQAALSASPNPGYLFINWTDEEGEIVSEEQDFSFLMPDSSVTLTSNFLFLYGGGSGTEDDPWHIAAAEHLDNIRHYTGNDTGPRYYFDQVADISLDEAPWNEGEGWIPVGETALKFNGSYTGNMYTISGLYINRPDKSNQGLFGHIGPEGVVNTVNLDNANITGLRDVGSLAGINDGSINSSSASGVLIAVDVYNWGAGGLVGTNSGTVAYSFADVEVLGGNSSGGLAGRNTGEGSIIKRSFATGNVKGYNAGGLVGSNNADGLIINCYATGSVAGDMYVGGLVGWNRGSTVSHSYSAGHVLGTGDDSRTGGLVGFNSFFQRSAVVSNSFWNIETSMQETSEGGGGAQGRNSAEMIALNTFSEWDFEDVWNIDEGDTYPYLQWQVDPGSHNYPVHFYILTLSVDPDGSGTAEGEGTFPEGGYAEITASALGDYIFINWIDEDGNIVSGQESFLYTMPGRDITLTANFGLHELIVEVNPADAGTVIIDPEQEIFNEGDEVSLTAMAAEGWQFVNWTGADGNEINDQAVYDLTMPGEDLVITANFARINYTLTVFADPDIAGTVNIDPDQEYYHAGDVVKLTAIPEAGWEFAGWFDGDDEISGSADFDFVMPAENSTLEARFARVNYTLTLAVSPEETGIINVDPERDYYHLGDSVTLTVMPNEGYRLLYWADRLGNQISNQQSFVFTFEDNSLIHNNEVLLIVYLFPENYSLNVGIEPETAGNVEIEPYSTHYNMGDTVTLTAFPASGWTFMNWLDGQDNVISDQTDLEIVFPADDVHLTASFALADLTLSVEVEPAGSGSVTVDPDKEFYNMGDTVILTASPEPEWEFLNWTDQHDNLVSELAEIEFIIPAEGGHLTANFVPRDTTLYLLTLEALPTEGGTVSGGGNYLKGEDVDITATASEGWEFYKWTDSDDVVISFEESFTFVMRDHDVTLTAHFIPHSYSLSVEVEPAGSGSVSVDPVKEHYNAGDLISMAAIAEEGWTFVRWTGNEGEEVSDQAEFDYSMPAGDAMLIANFAPEDYTLIVEIEPAGSGMVSIDPDQPFFNINDEISLTAIPEDDWLFVNWTDAEGIEISIEPGFIFTMPGRDVVITANFDLANIISDPGDGGLVISPVPANDHIIVESEQMIRELRVIDISGQVIMHVDVNAHTRDLAVGSLPSGVYLMRVELEPGGEFVIRRFVISR